MLCQEPVSSLTAILFLALQFPRNHEKSPGVAALAVSSGRTDGDLAPVPAERRAPGADLREPHYRGPFQVRHPARGYAERSCRELGYRTRRGPDLRLDSPRHWRRAPRPADLPKQEPTMVGWPIQKRQNGGHEVLYLDDTSEEATGSSVPTAMGSCSSHPPSLLNGRSHAFPRLHRCSNPSLGMHDIHAEPKSTHAQEHKGRQPPASCGAALEGRWAVRCPRSSPVLARAGGEVLSGSRP
ncbi:hypothetical protein SAMN05443639_109226 [Stigmatella erecta]|uniref:Uncharacterized protein n=1 Tax=Stigmatella erecta TaxID=83460 RepID=A0A1I0K8J9_9BACT|nr:hypothetical protein SAMN05443639_109226 [Stigmatella erecta]